MTLKDHDNEDVLFEFVRSQARYLKKQAAKENIQIERVSLAEGESYLTHTLATLRITKNMSETNAEELRQALPKLRQWISLKLVDDCANGELFNSFFKLLLKIPLLVILNTISDMKHELL